MSRTLIGVIAGVLLAGGVGLALALGGGDDPTPPEKPAEVIEPKPEPTPPVPPLVQLRGAPGVLRAVDFSANGHAVAAAGDSGVIGLWRRETGESVGGLEGHEGRVDSLRFLGDGRTLVSAGADGSVRVWNYIARSPLRRLRPHDGGAAGIALSRGRRQVAVGGAGGRIDLYTRQGLRFERSLGEHKSSIRDLVYAPDNTCLISVGVGKNENAVRTWPLIQKGLSLTIPDLPSPAETPEVLYANGQPLFAASFRDGDRLKFRVWPMMKQEKLADLGPLPGMVEVIAMSADGRFVATSCRDGESARLDVWATSDWESRGSATLPGLRVRALAFSADGRDLAVVGDGTPAVWRWGGAD